MSVGGAPYFGSAIGRLNRPIVGMASTPDGNGYWLVAADGGVFSYGDAKFFGSIAGSTTVVDMASTSDGLGYTVVGSGGQLFAFGDAPVMTSPSPVNGPLVAITGLR
jgi:hypothetical protein